MNGMYDTAVPLEAKNTACVTCSRQGKTPRIDLGIRARSVADGKALARVCWFFQLVHECYGVVLEGDAAALLVR